MASFSFIFFFSLQKFNINFAGLDSNREPLLLEATALPTEPQTLPQLMRDFRCSVSFQVDIFTPAI